MTTEVIKTIRASGGDYTTLSAWEAALPASLVTADEQHTAVCYNDWPSGLVDTVAISGSTTDATRYIKVTVAEGHRHDGIPQSGFYIKKSATYGFILSAGSSYSVVEWLDSYNTATSVQQGDGITLGAYCVGRYLISKAGRYAFTVSANASASRPRLENSLGYGSQYGSFTANYYYGTIDNCTFTGNTSGVYPNGTNARILVRNTVCYNNTTNFYVPSSSCYESGSSNNAASSGTPPGADSFSSAVTSSDFADSANNDFHLVSGSALIGAGTNLYATFDHDIDGDIRPSSGAWDIGFDHYVAAGGGTTTSNADPGSITITGSASAGTRSLLSTASSGAFTITGASSTGTRTLLSQASPGSYTVTGSASAGTYTPAGSTTSNAAPGAYTLTGFASAGVRRLLSNAAVGSIVITGYAASAIKAVISSAASGSYTITGAETSELWQHVSDASPGAWTITGYPLTGALLGAGVTLSPEDIAAIADAVFTRLSAGYIPVDVLRINGATVVGNGTSGDKWRGA